MSTTLQSSPPTEAESPVMTIQIYNTLTRNKEPLEPVNPGRIGIYLCGPTVYKEAHIGHMVGPVIFDCIKRYLTYSGFEVTWIVNITDVDDKLIAQSQERGISMNQVATEMTMDYCANLLALGVDQITHLPKATENMDEIIRFIQDLIEKDFAYAVEGDVFFDVAQDPQYGKLSNRKVEDQQGEGGGAAAKKRSSGDFALWKAAKPEEPSWESPWGPGRPGWHIECSAMSRRILGQTFDIHGGGLDLIFPHHENEIAQSECCHGQPMAKYWVHNGLLRAGEAGKIGGRADRQQREPQVDEEESAQKMSRSKGAGGLRSQITRFGGDRIRFCLLRTHYRSTIVFSDEGIAEAGTALDKFYTFFERYERITSLSFYLTDTPTDLRRLISRRADGEFDPAGDGLLIELKKLRDSFLTKMDDDFNTGAAVSDLFQMLSALNKFVDDQKLEDSSHDSSAMASFLRGCETLRELSAILGLFLKPPQVASGGSGGDDDVLDDVMRVMMDLRTAAREKKDFETADQIRDRLGELGIVLEDRKGETGWKRQADS